AEKASIAVFPAGYRKGTSSWAAGLACAPPIYFAPWRKRRTLRAWPRGISTCGRSTSSPWRRIPSLRKIWPPSSPRSGRPLRRRRTLRIMVSPRLGPRPLPLHLASAAMLWLSSCVAWPLWRNGSLRLRAELDPRASALAQSLAGVAPEAFAAALDAELRHRGDLFLRGLERYRHHPYRRPLADPPVIWREGATQLLDYGPPDGAPVLVVPSLINRAYILDLAPGKSLLRFLAEAGLRPLLVDWGRPGPAERRFTLTDYIAGRLVRALDAAAAAAGGPLAVVGYCMGGLLALALAQLRERL